MKAILMVAAAFWLVALGFLAVDSAFAAQPLILDGASAPPLAADLNEILRSLMYAW